MRIVCVVWAGIHPLNVVESSLLLFELFMRFPTEIRTLVAHWNMATLLMLVGSFENSIIIRFALHCLQLNCVWNRIGSLMYLLFLLYQLAYRYSIRLYLMLHYVNVKIQSYFRITVSFTLYTNFLVQYCANHYEPSSNLNTDVEPYCIAQYHSIPYFITRTMVQRTITQW